MEYPREWSVICDYSEFSALKVWSKVFASPNYASNSFFIVGKSLSALFKVSLA
jgi:hypothetical protein